MTNLLIRVGVVLALGLALFAVTRSESVGGLVHPVQEIFVAGIKAGSSETEVINSSAELTAVINTTAAATITGETNLDTLVFGGDSTALTATTTLTAAQMCNSAYFSIVESGADTETVADLTTPTGAQLISDCIPTIGDAKMFMLQNTATTTFDVTWVAGSNIELIEPSGGDVIIQQNEWADVKFLNVDGTVVAVLVTSVQDGD